MTIPFQATGHNTMTEITLQGSRAVCSCGWSGPERTGPEAPDQVEHDAENHKAHPVKPTPPKAYRGPAGSPIINKLIGCDVTIGFASGREYRGHLLTVDFQGWGRMVLDRGEPTSRVVIVNLRRAEVIE